MTVLDHPTRILLAEADRTALSAHIRELEALGHTVLAVSDGLECLERLRSQPPDVLVLEAELPWGGGDGVLAVCQEEPELRQIPVIVLVGGRSVSLLYRLALFEIGDLLFKPVPPRTLAQRVAALISLPARAQKLVDNRHGQS